MRRFFLRLTLVGWLLIMVTIVATIGFGYFLEHGVGGNDPDSWWFVPNRPRWGKAVYSFLAAFPILFFLVVGAVLDYLGFPTLRETEPPAKQ